MVMQELSSAGGERLSKGEAHFLRYGLSGARGEAESGFLTVRTRAMPVFTRMMEETGDSNLALLQTLLHLMAWNDDTNRSRGGLAGLKLCPAGGAATAVAGRAGGRRAGGAATV